MASQKTIRQELEELADLAFEINQLSRKLERKRERRNKLALKLVDAGVTFRVVAEHAGFENPYLVQLRKKQNGQVKNTGRGKTKRSAKTY